jgi:hypothetical protein
MITVVSSGFILFLTIPQSIHKNAKLSIPASSLDTAAEHFLEHVFEGKNKHKERRKHIASGTKQHLPVIPQESLNSCTRTFAKCIYLGQLSAMASSSAGMHCTQTLVLLTIKRCNSPVKKNVSACTRFSST